MGSVHRNRLIFLLKKMATVGVLHVFSDDVFVKRSVKYKYTVD